MYIYFQLISRLEPACQLGLLAFQCSSDFEVFDLILEMVLETNQSWLELWYTDWKYEILHTCNKNVWVGTEYSKM